ncbi:uncharacterized protein LOC135926796 [Gordionus sp. m RMFG-2023]|uniref:uncharacterized protein LOC135926796 n=1 Tax=Gordionus sp. m RMFG-2023 TaxID=3053472 RepID=UPI0031FBEC4F
MGNLVEPRFAETKHITAINDLIVNRETCWIKSYRNEGMIAGRVGVIMDVLHRRHIDVGCIRETRWKGYAARISRTNEKYKLFLQVSNDDIAGVGVFVAEKWVDKVIEVRRLDNQIMIINIIFGRRLCNIITAYVP